MGRLHHGCPVFDLMNQNQQPTPEGQRKHEIVYHAACAVCKCKAGFPHRRTGVPVQLRRYLPKGSETSIELCAECSKFAVTHKQVQQ
jgi:hypothetical protein